MNIVNLHIGKLNLCYVTYISNGRREREERERKRDGEREPCRIMLFTIRWELRYVFTRQFSRVLTPGPSSLGFSRESPAGDMWCYVAYVYHGEMFSLIGNQRVGIFPPKSKILFYLSLASIWCQNFQDETIPVGRDTWTSWSAERKNNNNNKNKNREISRSGLVFSVKYLQNGKRYSSSVSTSQNRKSHATKRYIWRFCSCYRFRDMKSSTSGISNADLFGEQNRKPRNDNSYGLIIKIIIRIRTRETNASKHMRKSFAKTTETK